MGIKRNVRQLGVVTQQLENPQQPENSFGSGESRLSSTFHSTTSNDNHFVPLVLGNADLHQAEADPAAPQVEQQEDPEFSPNH
jgi:hypothetical protein